MSEIIRPVKGTRDFYPDQMVFRNWLYNHIRIVAERYGYQEWEAPILETLELYAAKSGDELVKEQAFVFEDRGGSLVALRPELTPSLARMVAQHRQRLNVPLRWWSFGPFWRYERPQKGRAREFFQWNVDLLGSTSLNADAEVASVAAALLSSVGLSSDEVVIRVNSLQLMERRIAEIGITKDFQPAVFRLIDRSDKMAESKWLEYGQRLGLNNGQLTALIEMLYDTHQWGDSEQLCEFFQITEYMGTREWFEFDPRIVRGLDYYTGVVYEARDKLARHRAILGGGRYDNLVSEVGGEPISGTGFAMGDVVIQLIAQEFEVVPDINPCRTQILVTLFGDESIVQSNNVANELRQNDLRVEVYPDVVKLKSQLRYADRQGIPIVIVLGPDEIEAGEVSIKQLVTGEQSNIPLARVVQTVRKILESE
jgi:histidyl-tRNA synthetase